MDQPLLTDDFKEFLRLLNANRVDYLLVGGYAVGLHGYPRATVDLDIWVSATAENAARVIAVLAAFGFESSSIELRLFVDPRSIVRFGIPPFRIEIMTSIDGVDYASCSRRAVTFDVEGVQIPVIALADLRVNKRAAGRHKDLADLENLPPAD
jgi:Aminoglycoside-2''-adenylyltransferase